MNNTNTFLARGYSKAMFTLASRSIVIEPTLVWLEFLSESIKNPEVKATLANNLIPATDKIHLLLQLTLAYEKKYNFDKPKQQQLTNIPEATKRRFLELLANNNALLLLSDIYQHYDHLFLLSSNKMRITVVSALELSVSEQQAIISRLHKKFNKQLFATFELDATIISGLQIKYQDQIIDYSLKNSLSQLRNLLIS